jgi:hypothetical protein
MFTTTERNKPIRIAQIRKLNDPIRLNSGILSKILVVFSISNDNPINGRLKNLAYKNSAKIIKFDKMAYKSKIRLIFAQLNLKSTS